jgi:hypothetical protein
VGSRLYSNDFASDLRTPAAAIARRRLIRTEAARDPDRAKRPGAGDGDDEDHATFWLVVADQFLASRPDSRRRRANGRSRFIDDDRDLSMNAALGMSEALLRKRRQMLQELRAKLSAPPSAKRGPTIKKPQPFNLRGRRPHRVPDVRWQRHQPVLHAAGAAVGRRQSPVGARYGWSALIVMIDRGRAFDFLVWYRGIIPGPARQRHAGAGDGQRGLALADAASRHVFDRALQTHADATDRYISRSTTSADGGVSGPLPSGNTPRDFQYFDCQPALSRSGDQPPIHRWGASRR